MSPWHLRQAVHHLHQGGLLAYPTEAVYGLGCDPRNEEAVLRLLALKQRPWQKGLILVAADYSQLEPYLLPLSSEVEQRVFSTWPGPNTWILPARPEVPQWLRGQHRSLAVRISAHPPVAELCRAWGDALISTSANLTGRPPIKRAWQLRRQQLGHSIDAILPAELGQQRQPTAIRDGLSGALLRASA